MIFIALLTTLMQWNGLSSQKKYYDEKEQGRLKDFIDSAHSIKPFSVSSKKKWCLARSFTNENWILRY